MRYGYYDAASEECCSPIFNEHGYFEDRPNHQRLRRLFYNRNFSDPARTSEADSWILAEVRKLTSSSMFLRDYYYYYYY